MLSFSSPLRRLLIAQIPADFSDWLDFVAISAMLAFVWSAPPMAFAWLAVAMGAPAFVLGPLLAGRVDQADLRNVMIGANLGRAAVTCGLAFAPSWPALIGLVALRSAVDSAYSPAKQAALQAAATEDELMPANQASQAINHVSKIAAPALGGALIAAIAPRDVFLINAGVSLLAALLLLRFPAALRAPAEPESTWAGLRSAVALIRGNDRLRFAVGAGALVLGAVFLFDALIPPHLKALGFSQQVVGFTVSATGLGTVIGALLPMRETPIRMSWELGIGAMTSAALLVWLGTSEIAAMPPGLPVLIGVFFVFGVISARVFIPLRVILQRETPKAQMARVAALSEAANTGAMLVPPFVGATIAQISSTGWSFVAAGVVFAVMAPALWRMAR